MPPVLATRPVKVFYVEYTGKCTRALRIYGGECPARGGNCCDASIVIGDNFDVVPYPGVSGVIDSPRVVEYIDDPRWPTHCEHCQRAFTEGDTKQIFVDSVLRRTDGSQQATLRQWEKIAGAMWDMPWLHDWKGYIGPDGLSLCIVCPDGAYWYVDGPASNCTMKGDYVHKCWVRTGPLDRLTAGKGGNTCAAGAGSILTEHWHGFLKDGYLVDA